MCDGELACGCHDEIWCRYRVLCFVSPRTGVGAVRGSCDWRTQPVPRTRPLRATVEHEGQPIKQLVRDFWRRVRTGRCVEGRQTSSRSSSWAA